MTNSGKTAAPGLHKATGLSSTIKSLSYTQVVVALVVLGSAYLYVDKNSALNRFGEAVTERLCDMLPPKPKDATPTEATPTGPAPPKLTRYSSYNPKLAGGKSYDSKSKYTLTSQVALSQVAVKFLFYRFPHNHCIQPCKLRFAKVN